MEQPRFEFDTYKQRFLIGLFSLLTSRKFWLSVLAELTAAQQYAAGALNPREFIAATLTILIGLVISIAYEDGQALKARGAGQQQTTLKAQEISGNVELTSGGK